MLLTVFFTKPFTVFVCPLVVGQSVSSDWILRETYEPIRLTPLTT